MIPKDKLIEIAIFGVLGGISGASIALLWIAGFKAEHIFALAGAVIGAAATVGGAIWVTDRNASIEAKKETDLLLDDLAILLKDGTVVRDFDRQAAANWTDEYDSATFEFGYKIRGSRLLTAQAVENSKALNFRQRAACHGLNEALVDAEKFFHEKLEEGGFAAGDQHGWMEQVNMVIDRTTETIAFVRHPAAK